MKKMFLTALICTLSLVSYAQEIEKRLTYKVVTTFDAEWISTETKVGKEKLKKIMEEEQGAVKIGTFLKANAQALNLLMMDELMKLRINRIAEIYFNSSPAGKITTEVKIVPISNDGHYDVYLSIETARGKILVSTLTLNLYDFKKEGGYKINALKDFFVSSINEQYRELTVVENPRINLDEFSFDNNRSISPIRKENVSDRSQGSQAI